MLCNDYLSLLIACGELVACMLFRHVNDIDAKKHVALCGTNEIG